MSTGSRSDGHGRPSAQRWDSARASQAFVAKERPRRRSARWIAACDSGKNHVGERRFIWKSLLGDPRKRRARCHRVLAPHDRAARERPFDRRRGGVTDSAVRQAPPIQSQAARAADVWVFTSSAVSASQFVAQNRGTAHGCDAGTSLHAASTAASSQTSTASTPSGARPRINVRNRSATSADATSSRKRHHSEPSKSVPKTLEGTSRTAAARVRSEQGCTPRSHVRNRRGA